MRIVLLGATGFVGHHLLPVLSAAGHHCLALSRYAPGCRELRLIPRVEIRQERDWTAEKLSRHMENADAVISMVGILNESGPKGKGFNRVHVGLVENILEACKRSGVRRLLHVSALNAGKGKSQYLLSKGKAEECIRAATDIDSTIVQPSVIFGDGDAFFNRFYSLLKMTPVMPLACPNARLQPVWVNDVARAMAAALLDDDTIGETLVMVGPEEYSLRELVEFTARCGGLNRRIQGLPDMLARLQGMVMGLVPGKPFSTDNYLSLQTDNTSVENSLWRFGIEPRSIESIVPGYLAGTPCQNHLDEYRKSIGS